MTNRDEHNPEAAMEDSFRLMVPCNGCHYPFQIITDVTRSGVHNLLKSVPEPCGRT